MEPEPLKETRKVFNIADLPRRPKPVNGDYGQALRFISNYYRINFKEKDQMFYQYELTFEPQLPKDARKTIKSILTAIKADLESKVGSYVERGTMVWVFRTPKQNLSFKCKVNNEQGQQQQFIIFLKKTTEFSMNKLEAGGKDSQQVIQVLNSILKKKMAEIGMVEIGRNSKFYDKKAIDDAQIAGSDLKVWRGFTTSIQIVTGKAYLMVDFNTRVLRSINLYEHMKKLSRDEKRDLVGQTVLAPYGNYRTYRIEGFDEDQDANSTFEKQGVKVTFREYFKKAYGVTIREMDQPLIKTSIKKKMMGKNGVLEEVIEPIFILPELVYLTGMTDNERADRRLMQSMANYTKLEPAARIDCNQDLLQNRTITENEIFTI